MAEYPNVLARFARGGAVPATPPVAPPPGLYTAMADREKSVMRSLFGSGSASDGPSSEVVVKNTFLHVEEDVEQPLRRSRSESDLQSSVSSSQSDRRGLNNSSSIELTQSSTSSASSAADKPVGTAHPRALPYAPRNAISASFVSDGPREGAASSALSHAPRGASNDRPVGYYDSSASSQAPGFAGAASPTRDIPYGGEFWDAPSHAPGGVANARPVGVYHSSASSRAPGFAGAARPTGDKPYDGEFWDVPSHAPGASNDRPVGVYHSSASSHAPGFTCPSNPISGRTCGGKSWDVPSHPPGASSDRPVADYRSSASSHAPGFACSTNSISSRPCGGKFWHVPSYASDGAADERPDWGHHSSIPPHASCTARSAIFANDRTSMGTTWNALHHAPGGTGCAPCGDSRSDRGTSLIAYWPSCVGAPRMNAEDGFPTVDEIQEQDETGEPSAGSANHDAGDCKPCMYYHTSKGCRNGRSCLFCHLPHPSRQRARPSKAKRDQCKQIATMLGDDIPGDPRRVVNELCSTNKEKAYLLSILEKKAQRQYEERCEQSEVDPSGVSSTQHDVRRQPVGRWKMSL